MWVCYRDAASSDGQRYSDDPQSVCARLDGLHVLSLRQHDPHTRKEQLVLPADASQKIVFELEEKKRNSMEKDDRLGSAFRGCPLDGL